MPLGMFGKISGPPGLGRRRGGGAFSATGGNISEVSLFSRGASTISNTGTVSASSTRKFGSNSLRYTANTNAYSTYDIQDSGVRVGGANTATLEFWWYRDTTTSQENLDLLRFGNKLWRLQGGSSSTRSCLHMSLNAATIYNETALGSNNAWNFNTWHHWAFVSNGNNTITLYHDGVAVYTYNEYGASYAWQIGAYPGPFANDEANIFVNIDEVRISSTARYTSNFTPSTTQFENDSDTVGLFHMESTSQTDDRGNATTYIVHEFQSNGTFVPTTAGAVDVLVVGAGGAGMSGYTASYAGGGGGGGIIFASAQNVAAQSYSITVAPQTSRPAYYTNPINGSSSSAFNLTAGGGEGGYHKNLGSYNGGSSGSPQSNSGGVVASNQARGGGGGGAGGNGTSGASTTGGNGGPGLYYGDIFGTTYGVAGWFGGGGGGGGNTPGSAQHGGGTQNNAGTNGTGGGGGAGSYNNINGTRGGSGIVLIRYPA